MFGGEDLVHLAPDDFRDIRGRRISMVSQDPLSALNPVLTIGEHLMDIQFRETIGANEKRDRAIEALKSVKGEIFAPAHGYLLRRAGKQPGAHEMALVDIFRGRDKDLKKKLQVALREGASSTRYAAAVTGGSRRLMKPFTDRFVQAAPLVDGPDAFFPVTGEKVRPERLLRRRDSRDASQTGNR